MFKIFHFIFHPEKYTSTLWDVFKIYI